MRYICIQQILEIKFMSVGNHSPGLSKLNTEIASKLVNVLGGYKTYIEEKREKRRKFYEFHM